MHAMGCLRARWGLPARALGNAWGVPVRALGSALGVPARTLGRSWGVPACARQCLGCLRVHWADLGGCLRALGSAWGACVRWALPGRPRLGCACAVAVPARCLYVCPPPSSPRPPTTAQGPRPRPRAIRATRPQAPHARACVRVLVI